jgi:hypothetical protein
MSPLPSKHILGLKVALLLLFFISPKSVEADFDDEILISRSKVSGSHLGSRNIDNSEKTHSSSLSVSIPLFTKLNPGKENWSYRMDLQASGRSESFEDTSKVRTALLGTQIYALRGEHILLGGLGAYFLDPKRIDLGDNTHGFSYLMYGKNIGVSTMGFVGGLHLGSVSKIPVIPILGISHSITPEIHMIAILPAFISFYYAELPKLHFYFRAGANGINGVSYRGSERGDKKRLSQLKTGLGAVYKFSRDWDFSAEIGTLAGRKIRESGNEQKLENARYASLKFNYRWGGSSIKDLLLPKEISE